MEATCHLRGPRKSVDFWGADRLGGGAQTKWGGGRWNFSIFLHIIQYYEHIMEQRDTGYCVG